MVGGDFTMVKSACGSGGNRQCKDIVIPMLSASRLRRCDGRYVKVL